MPYPQTLTLTGLNLGSITEAVFTPMAIASMIQGLCVETAPVLLPESGSAALFNVTGKVKITQLLGVVTTVIQTQACNYSLEFNPTAAGSNVALCAVLNISAIAVDTLLGVTGTAATALVAGMSLLAQATPLILQAGAIEHKTSATNTGGVEWYCWYLPMTDDGAIVAA